jgi:hypothetical protein
MKQLLIILLVAIVSCTNRPSGEQQENKTANDSENTVATVPSNSGTKWKADEATKKNVAAMEQVVNDTAYSDASKRKQLYTNMMSKVDTLVKQCSMKGAEHEALHAWLQKVLKDLKELKEEKNEYREAYATLTKDVKNFHQSFE